MPPRSMPSRLVFAFVSVGLFLAPVGAEAARFVAIETAEGDSARTFDTYYAPRLTADGQRALGNRAGYGTQATWTELGGFQLLDDSIPPAPDCDHCIYTRTISADGSRFAGEQPEFNETRVFIFDLDSEGRGTAVPFASAPIGLNGDGFGVWNVPALSGDGRTAVVLGYSRPLGGSSATSNETFLWREGAGFESIGHLPNSRSTFGQAISADGRRVVGTAMIDSPVDQPSSGGSLGFVWDAHTGLQRLSPIPTPLPGVPQTLYRENVNDLSSDGGTAVGQLKISVPFGFEGGVLGEAIAWETSGDSAPRRLGLMPGFDRSEAVAVSSGGRIIVGKVTRSVPVSETQIRLETRAMIFDEAVGELQFLDVYLAALGIELEGWELHEASDVSEDGTRLIGFGRNPEGVLQSWYAVIPEPSTGLLVGLGLMVLAAGGRSQSHLSRPC